MSVQYQERYQYFKQYREKNNERLQQKRHEYYEENKDKLQPRNINISFNNNSNLAIDIMVFIFYSDEFVIDVETGIIDK